MPFAPQIRKNILQALDEHIIPALQNQLPVQVLARPPFEFSAVQNWTISEQYLPFQEIELSQYIWHWNDQGMVANRMQFLGFVFQGIADEKIGLTDSMAETLRRDCQPLPAGITAIRLPAPAVIAIPEHIAHRSGSTHYHETEVPGGGPSSILWIHLMGDAVLPHLYSTISPDISSHSLHVPDRLLVQMGQIYFDELRFAHNDRHASAQHLLLSFMCRLRRYLAENRADLSNSCWEVLHPQDASLASQINGRNQEVCRQVIDHIEMHLHSPLTLETLAQVAGVSVPHLSRVFRQTKGHSLMSYVSQRRIEAAKAILVYQPERIDDLARLVGFAHASSFCAVFKRQTGYSPREFSRHHRDASNITPARSE